MAKTKVIPQVEILPVVLRLQPVINLTDDQLFEFCQLNRDWRIELTAEGELLIMPPTFGETGAQNAKITMRLGMWVKRDGNGVGFDSSTGFTLPNGAMRSPDAAWVHRSRLAGLTKRQKEKFLPLCPDFVIELRSLTDRLADLQAKVDEYIENGAQLGWLIDPGQKRVYVYRPQAQVERLDRPDSLSGEPTLPGFVLDLKEIWELEL